MTFLDVGQGDSALIEAPNGQRMLIDAGDTDQGETVLAALRERGVQKLDWAVASHPHADHIGGYLDVLPAIHASQLLDSTFATGSRIQQKLLQAVRDGRTNYRPARAGEAFDLGKVRVEVIAPSAQWVKALQEDAERAGEGAGRRRGSRRDGPPYEAHTNNASVVLRLIYGKTRFLFTGDLEEDGRQAIYRSREAEKLEADVLKVSHHGSHNGTDDEFLRRVHPRYAVISCAKGNEYGHPHKEAMDALRRAGVEIYRTDEQGTIAVSSDGERLQWQTHVPTGASPAPTRGPATDAKQVVGNRDSHVYHRPDCASLPRKANQVVFANAKTARAAGYRPHPACAP